MPHEHCRHSHDSCSNLKIAFFLNLAFTVIEFIGGFLTNSVAIIADSLHDLGDSLSIGCSWILNKYSKKGRSKRFSYGYRRFSLLAALINAIVLIIGSAFILIKAIPRILHPEKSHYTGMLLLAILGIIVNGTAVLRLKKGSSLNEKMVLWHLLEDVFGWVAVLIVSIVNIFYQIPILDPILAVLFTLIILYQVLKNLKQITTIFLQGTPNDIDIKSIEEKIKLIKNVKSIHDIHLWTMDNEVHVLTIHVVVKNKTSFQEIKKIKCKVREIAHSFNINHITVEIEGDNETCEYKSC